MYCSCIAINGGTFQNILVSIDVLKNNTEQSLEKLFGNFFVLPFPPPQKKKKHKKNYDFFPSTVPFFCVSLGHNYFLGSFGQKYHLLVFIFLKILATTEQLEFFARTFFLAFV